jgi:hypothetical protein
MRLRAVALLLAACACRAAAPDPAPAPPTRPATTPTAPAPTPLASGPVVAYVTGDDGALRLHGADGRSVNTGVRTANPWALAWAGPLLYWQDETGLHRLDPRTGVVTDVPLDPRYRLQAARGADLVVTDDTLGSGSGGGPEDVLLVSPDGRVSKQFTDGDGRPEGDGANLRMTAVTVTADGRRLLYGSGATAGPLCDRARSLRAWDLVARRPVEIASPVLVPGTANTVDSGATGLDGRTFVSVRTKMGECPAKVERTAVFELRGTRWALFREDAIWASTGPRGEVALLRPTVVEEHRDWPAAELYVDGRFVAHRVTFAAWGDPRG